MESDNCDSDIFNHQPAPATASLSETIFPSIGNRFISAYMQHITDVCDPPRT